jgi:hypothetical protein
MHPSFLRRLTCAFLWLTAFFPLTAQTVGPPRPAVPDPRLFEVFDRDYLERLERERPQLLLRWNFYLDHAFIVSPYPAGKGDIARLPVVRIDRPEDFNILALEKQQRLERDWKVPVLYRINDSGQVLMYLSGKEFNRKFQAWLRQP